MEYTELLTLVSKDETRTLELKKSTGELKDAMHSVCAMLNSDGGMWKRLSSSVPSVAVTLAVTLLMRQV